MSKAANTITTSAHRSAVWRDLIMSAIIAATSVVYVLTLLEIGVRS